jgi:hypothetical protein
MHHRSQLRIRPGLAGAAIAGITTAVCCLPLPVASAKVAQTASRAAPAVTQTARVSPNPATGTPELVPSTSTVEQVRQLVQCGGTMYAVGTFTQLSQNNAPITRDNIFSFRATAPYTVTAWDPNVNGTVDTIAFAPGTCADAYIGGKFTSVGGTAAANIAEIDTATGAVVPGFGHNASGEVETLAVANGHLLAGGKFIGINNNHDANPYLASLNLVTGKDDGFVHLNISGHYVFSGVHTNSTMVYNQQLSHGGTLDLVEGIFTSVGGLARQQIFMLNVGGTTAAVTGWSSPEFDGSQGNLPGGYPYQCGDSHPFYIQAASWSPDDSAVYIADTGFRPWNRSTGFPLVGLCDAVAAFPATRAEVLHYWINYTGCDSLFSIAADPFAVYVGGHERWADNANGCNKAGLDAVHAPGMGGFTPGPSGGALLENSGGTAGLYSRGRGQGADDEVITSAGLWIASDNFAGTQTCGGVKGLSGICFLPYQ